MDSLAHVELTPVLLTPVPLVHLHEAVEEFGTGCDAAFGSDAYEMMPGIEQGLPVLIYASHLEDESQPVVSWSALFVSWHTRLDREVRMRRASWTAANDGAFAGYYIVSNLRQLDVPISLGAFRKTDRTPLRMSVVRGPVVCLLPATLVDALST